MNPALYAALFATISGAFGGLPPDDAAIQAAGLKRQAVADVPAKQIEVFIDKDDAYSGLVLKALPAFAGVGRGIFGKDIPLIRLFLMSDEDRYRAFTKAIFGQELPAGTGNFHVVTMCLSCEKRRPEETETTAVVLHEFGHAWLNTYLKEKYDRDYLSDEIRRPYLDEGMADFIAGRWDGDFLNRRRQMIREFKISRGVRPPDIGELQSYSSFYDKGDRELHYWISALLIERMLGPTPNAGRKIPRYLDLIGQGKTPEQAWELATGKSIAAEYAALVRELWRN
jgi:hypothetical protein